MTSRRRPGRALALALVTAALAAPAGVAAPGPAGAAAAKEPPLANKDHWHGAYGIYICNRYIEHDLPDGDPVGIHTHGDGLIHIHPFVDSAAGANATLARFLETVQIAFTASTLTLPLDQGRWKTGDACGARTGRVRLLQFASATDTKPVEVKGDPGALRLREGQILAFVFAPDGVRIPPPPSVDNLDDPADQAPRNLTAKELAALPDLGPKPLVAVPPTAPPRSLSIKDLVVGKGALADAGKKPVIRFVVTSYQRKTEVFATSYNRSDQPSQILKLGRGRNLRFFDEGIIGMRVGGRRQIVAPPAWGFGAKGSADGLVKANESLIIVVDLLALR